MAGLSSDIDQPLPRDLKALVKYIKSGTADVKFVDSLPDELQSECSICLHILREPQIVHCCGYRFCKVCIEQVERDRGSCPLCKAMLFQKGPDKHLQRLLSQRKVFCLLREAGCTWQGELAKIRQHISVDVPDTDMNRESLCQFMPVICIMCDELFRRSSMSDHMLECPARATICQYCNELIPFRDLYEHHDVCPSYRVVCGNGCSLQFFKRKDLPMHYIECPLQMINCQHGCEEKLLRKDMPTHLEQNAIEHLTLLAGKLRRTEEENQELRENLAHPHNENLGTIGERVSELQEENRQLKKELEGKITISHLKVTHFAPETTSSMLKSRFGQYGPVKSIDLDEEVNYLFGFSTITSARIEFVSESSAVRALRSSETKGINLLSCRLTVEPCFDFSNV